MTETKINAGELAISLGGASYTLIPTLKAGLAVNKLFGGFVNADNKVRGYDLEAVALVFQAGLGDRAPDGITDLVFAEGLVKTAPAAIEFVGILANGGKRPTDAPSAEGNGTKSP